MSEKKRKMAAAFCAWCDLHLYADEGFKDEVYRLVKIHTRDCPSNPLVQQVEKLESENERLLDCVRYTAERKCVVLDRGRGSCLDRNDDWPCIVCSSRKLLDELRRKA